MIDLTYLTDQEQGMIMSVLKRDTNLKNTEEQRIKQLRKTEKDRSRLKYLTGDWFYDTKYKRHRDRINGTDILRASMGLRKPVTISEISQRFENPSCVNMERKDVFVPPELSGLIEEPSTQSQNERRTLSPSPPNKVDEWQFPEGQQEKQRPQIKPRQNPFNSVRSQRDTDSLKNGVKTDRAPTEESLAAESSSPHNAILNPDNTESQCTAKPVPKKRLLLYTRKELLQDASRISPGVKQIVTPAPRSISKKNGSNHKSVNSLRLHIPTNTDDSSYDQSSATISPISLEMPFSPPLSLCSVQSSSEWVDKRQVHFSSIVQPIESEREVRGVQDEDWSPLADGEKEQDRSGYINNDYHELNVEPQSTQVSNLHTTAAVTGNSEEHSPVRAALERANARPISVSKSLENLLSTPSLSAETPDTKPSSSDDEQMKMMSTSVPAFIHQEMDYSNSDCASVSSFYSDRLAACNASSTFSICSEVASLSSVTGSVISIYSSEFGNVEVKGTVQFAIQYLQKLGEFHIFVVQCKNLAVADPRKNRSDPYVKCYLLPDKARYGKRKTCVRKKTLDPTYNEVLRFKIPMKTLKTQKLNLSVWHNDTFGHNSFLGEVEIDLAEWDLNKTQMNECLLKGRQVQVPPSPKPARSEEIKAEMRVALRFLQQTSHTDKNEVNGEVQIWVKECKNLPMSQGVSVDPFVKCAVLPDSSHKNCQKTRVLKRAFNPEFDHTMVYDCFSPEDLNEVCVELTVWDHDRLHNHLIGGIRLGPGTGKSYGADVDWMDSNTAETALWKKLMQSQNEWVEGVLPLRMLLMAI